MNIAVAVLLFGYLISCKDSGTNPNQTIKTPREMTWTADTLPVPSGAIQVLPEDLLVVSPTDVWMAVWVGHGQIMHYDGKTWKMVKEIGGGIDCLVQGNSNDIWAGGYFGHQNGSQFTRSIYLGNYNGISWYDNELSMQSEILDMTKNSDGNIWACGRNGVVLKYEGKKWITNTIKVGYLKQNFNVSYLLKSIEYYKNNLFVLANLYDSEKQREIYYYIYGDINNWTVADSMVIDSPNSIIKWGYYGLALSPTNELYSYGLSGVWRYVNNQWIIVFEPQYQIFGMYAFSSNYIFAVGAFNHAFYYNGTSWDNISEILRVSDPTFVYKNVWTNGYETFITGYTTQGYPTKTIIFHGK